ncbi:hypothetical protein LGZ99_20675 [Photorhabdus temperata]|uniref:Uncharacterized protein n=1 Tax=Photorhabdus cinerea TaxID=471575 RepID=A0A7X5TGV1_9GAMM|nr:MULTISPECIES: hypothetical protein [Photorhabdus]MCT8349544.1 hypothetical protein [Photorhabdus temperata]NHB91232.1 hypothetical protein [Photorhabdus cinerea]
MSFTLNAYHIRSLAEFAGFTCSFDALDLDAIYVLCKLKIEEDNPHHLPVYQGYIAYNLDYPHFGAVALSCDVMPVSDAVLLEARYIKLLAEFSGFSVSADSAVDLSARYIIADLDFPPDYVAGAPGYIGLGTYCFDDKEGRYISLHYNVTRCQGCCREMMDSNNGVCSDCAND